MPDSKRFLHPEAIKRISRLDLRARHIVEGFLAGVHRSPYFGQSIEFRQHREYTRATTCAASTGKSGPSRTATTSSSSKKTPTCAARCWSTFPAACVTARGPLNKYEYGCTIAASLAYLLLRQQDAVGCVAFDSATRATVPLRSQRQHLDSIIQALDVSRPATEDRPLPDPAHRGRKLSAARADRAGFRSAGRASRACSSGLGCCVSAATTSCCCTCMDDDELDFPFNGPTRFEGLELPERLTLQPAGAARRIPAKP